MAKYLEKRRRRWYAVLDIPKDVKVHFDGRPRFVKSLETESLTKAELICPVVIAGWKAQIDMARSGSPNIQEDMQKLALEWQDDLKNASDEDKITYEEILNDKVAELARKSPERADDFAKIVTEGSFPTDHYISLWVATLKNEPKTIDMKRNDLRRFASEMRLSHQVTRSNVQKWTHRLQFEAGLKSNTVRRIISSCRGYWSYLRRTGVVPSEPDPFLEAVERRPKSKLEIADRRKPYTPQQLAGLWNGANAKKDQPLADLIWLAMWTGCRIEELCALKVASVEADRFTVEDAKSEAGWREIPIHSRLSKRLEQLKRSSTDGYVISGLTFSKYADRSNAIGKRFGNLRTKLGFGPDYVFHSIRKTVVTLLENASVAESVSADIVGHEKQTLTYGLYSGGTNFELKKEAIEKLAYPL